ncbi:uncharacterized protein LOC144655196 [Oculina patagonica]
MASTTSYYSISDAELRRQLKAFGEDVGPITDTTRPVFLRKLERLQNEQTRKKKPKKEQDSTEGPSSIKMAVRSTVRNLPFWVAVWLALSSIVCTIDALFVLLRPHTLPGGKWNYLFTPYNIYIKVDPSYKDMKDAFVVGQSLMNLVEVFINIVTIIMHISGKARLSVLLAFMVSTMTSSKTVLYFLVSSGLCGGHNFVSFVDWKETVLIYILPSGVWVLIPLLCMVVTGRMMIPCVQNGETTAKKQKSR